MCILDYQADKEKKSALVMSFSPARSQPDSISPRSGCSPVHKQREVQSTKWPPSPENTSSTTASEIVAEAKAKISRWSDNFLDNEPTKQPIPAPQKTKFVPKTSPKFDTRQAALNKLAAKRIALAKSKAKAGIKFGSKVPAEPGPDDCKPAASKPPDSLKHFTSGLDSSSTGDKPPASKAPVTPTANVTQSSSASDAKNKQTTLVADSNISTNMCASNGHQQVNVKSSHLPSGSVDRPVSAQLLRAMQATLVEQDNIKTDLSETSVGKADDKQKQLKSGELRFSRHERGANTDFVIKYTMHSIL